jgi:two-component system, OmpR family, response regulator
MPTLVLVVDDNELVRRAIVRALRDGGFATIDASDTQQALDVMESIAVDIVLTDVHMPNGNGRELLRRVRAAYPGLPIIACTGLDEWVLRGCDFDRVLFKPVSMEELKQAVTEVLGARS